MISSKIFTMSLHYIVNTQYITFNNACEQIRQAINKVITSEDFKEHMLILDQDVTLYIDNKADPRVNFIATLYTTIEDNKGLIKRMRTYIDEHIAKIELTYAQATLLRRRIY